MKNKNITKIGFIYFVCIILIAVIFVLGSFGLIKNDYLSSFLIQCVVLFAVPLLLYTLMVSKSTKQTFSDAGFKKINGKMIAISILLGVILYIINTFVASTFSSIIHMLGYESISLGSSVESISYLTLLKELFLSCFLPAVCEEFLHRGILMHANKKYSNPRYALFISSLLFGLLHLNINQFFYAAILGAFIGYVGLFSDSIFPCMIIHFMNNALSTYFYYGSFFNWPLANFINEFEAMLASNLLTFIVFVSLSIMLLIVCYRLLVKQMMKERAKMDIANIIKYLKANNLTIEQAQEKINQINVVMQQSLHLNKTQTEKRTMKSHVFYICSIVLGSLITIASFIWGLI